MQGIVLLAGACRWCGNRCCIEWLQWIPKLAANVPKCYETRTCTVSSSGRKERKHGKLDRPKRRQLSWKSRPTPHRRQGGRNSVLLCPSQLKRGLNSNALQKDGRGMPEPSLFSGSSLLPFPHTAIQRFSEWFVPNGTNGSGGQLHVMPCGAMPNAMSFRAGAVRCRRGGAVLGSSGLLDGPVRWSFWPHQSSMPGVGSFENSGRDSNGTRKDEGMNQGAGVDLLEALNGMNGTGERVFFAQNSNRTDDRMESPSPSPSPSSFLQLSVTLNVVRLTAVLQP